MEPVNVHFLEQLSVVFRVCDVFTEEEIAESVDVVADANFPVDQSDLNFEILSFSR